MASAESFKYLDLRIIQSTVLQNLPDPSSIMFGEVFSDHMLQVEWMESNGWGKPQITPIHSLHIHPGSKILHYGQSVFDGMKAFRRPDSKVALFRPDLNMKRFLSSAERASLPSFEWKELLKCIKSLIAVDLRWVPDDGKNSLYIRPNFIGCENTLGGNPSKNALLYVVMSPIANYFNTDQTNPLSLLADSDYVRAWPGGTGAFKMACNYGPTLYVQKEAQQQGLDQVLWLFGEDNQVCEVGAMNVFFLVKKEEGDLELVTPALDGTILAGVIRQTIIELVKKWYEFEVSERKIVMQELIDLNKENRWLEMFICGTAVGVAPVNLIRFKGEDIKIPTMQSETKMYARFSKDITDIQFGLVPSPWSVAIEENLI